MLLLALLAVLLLMRDRPSDLGLPVYGDRTVTPPPPAPGGLLTLLTSPLIALA